MKFRSLRADEIDVRIGTVGQKGVSLLLYKNARVDMAVLDETVGAMNWQRDHKEIKGNLFCGIGIRCSAMFGEKLTPANMFDTWVWKWDCGTESNNEKEKGESSDSFKRAGFNWGIGRELYTAPFIFCPTGTQKKASGHGYELINPTEFNGSFVSEIEYEELDEKRIITKLVLSQKAQGRVGEIYRWEYGKK